MTPSIMYSSSVLSSSSSTSSLIDSSPYVTFNPELFDDPEVWSSSSLRDLCQQLSIKHKGKRATLITRLMRWHRDNHQAGAPTRRKSKYMYEEEEEIPQGQNFAFLGIELIDDIGDVTTEEEEEEEGCSGPLSSSSVSSSPGEEPSERKDTDEPPVSANKMSDQKLPVATAPPSTSSRAILSCTKSSCFLAPLRPNVTDQGSIPKSILKKSSSFSVDKSVTTPALKSLAFSLYNGVQLIPSRKTKF